MYGGNDKYYNPTNKIVNDGEVARASDLNSINTATDSAFEQVANNLDDLSTAIGDAAATSEAWAVADAGQNPDALLPTKYSSEANATEAQEWANSSDGIINKANGDDVAAKSSHEYSLESSGYADESEGFRDQSGNYASDSLDHSKDALQYAVGEKPAGTPNEPAGGSSKHWAGESEAAAQSTGDNVILAQEWAENPAGADITGHPGSYSSLHHADNSATSATESLGFRDESQTAKDLSEMYAYGTPALGSSKEWAVTAKGVIVADGEYSAKHYAETAQDIVDASQDSFDDAITESENWAGYTTDSYVPESEAGDPNRYSAKHWAEKASETSVAGHLLISHTDVNTATGSDLDSLVDGSNADPYHTHNTVSSHTVASHSDTSATGAELNTLTNGSSSVSDGLHKHNVVASHSVASHSDTSATGSELNTLTNGSNADSLHDHTTLGLGETSATAYRGDRGKIAYDHSQSAHAPSDANNYVHPGTHPPSIIAETTSDRFISNSEASGWNDKYTQSQTDVLLAAKVSATGLEYVSDDGGTTYGWRLIGSKDSDNHGDIGEYAVDLSTWDFYSTTMGPTGSGAIAMGNGSTASGNWSIVGGYRCIGSGDHSVAFGDECSSTAQYTFSAGIDCIASYSGSAAFGKGVTTPRQNGFYCGTYNTGNANSIFEVGVGTGAGDKKCALEITTTGAVYLRNLPVTNPGGSDRLWNDGGTLKIT